MRNEVQKFHETVSILVKAYLNDELRHGDCNACAVGNLIYANLGNKKMWWPYVFMTSRLGEAVFDESAYCGDAQIEIDSTGYSPLELARVENAFEVNAIYDQFQDQVGDKDEQMFNGLMAVVDVLADIHGIDLSQKEHAKALFVKTL